MRRWMDQNGLLGTPLPNPHLTIDRQNKDANLEAKAKSQTTPQNNNRKPPRSKQHKQGRGKGGLESRGSSEDETGSSTRHELNPPDSQEPHSTSNSISDDESGEEGRDGHGNGHDKDEAGDEEDEDGDGDDWRLDFTCYYTSSSQCSPGDSYPALLPLHERCRHPLADFRQDCQLCPGYNYDFLQPHQKYLQSLHTTSDALILPVFVHPNRGHCWFLHIPHPLLGHLPRRLGSCQYRPDSKRDDRRYNGPRSLPLKGWILWMNAGLCAGAVQTQERAGREAWEIAQAKVGGSKDWTMRSEKDADSLTDGLKFGTSEDWQLIVARGKRLIYAPATSFTKFTLIIPQWQSRRTSPSPRHQVSSSSVSRSRSLQPSTQQSRLATEPSPEHSQWSEEAHASSEPIAEEGCEDFGKGLRDTHWPDEPDSYNRDAGSVEGLNVFFLLEKIKEEMAEGAPSSREREMWKEVHKAIQLRALGVEVVRNMFKVFTAIENELVEYARHLEGVKVITSEWGVELHLDCLESLYRYYTETEEELKEHVR
ncbi:hypothetical protein BKA65DRAFT_485723 [Rhexocercosporidium sp. MPI-PUGE-AT-0058]|nr:hypothetical protein BKA65DRAFT_485723 [Rhexocercosporidium sp. MPI-PUGE-AT-0058]